MGVVYEAKHATLGRRVAIKVLHAHEAGAPKSDLVAKRFLREGRAAASVKHAHVVDVFDFGVHEGTPFLVMELIEGETLAQRIAREGAIPLAKVVELLLPIASAVAELHAAGIVHRDLKPANILLAREKNGAICPKVGDFGVSRLDDGSAGLTESGVVVGTCAYMSPEQALSSKGAMEHSDQYALGAILYECVTGKLPFEGETPYAVTHAVLNAPLAPPSARNAALPPDLDAVVLRAMARDPEARFESIEELGEALLPFAARDIEQRWAAEFRPASKRAPVLSNAPLAAPPIVAAAPSKRRSRVATWIGTGAVAGLLVAAAASSNRAAIPRGNESTSVLAARPAAPGSNRAEPFLPAPSLAGETPAAASAPAPTPTPTPAPTPRLPAPTKARQAPTSRAKTRSAGPLTMHPETPATDNGAPILDAE